MTEDLAQMVSSQESQLDVQEEQLDLPEDVQEEVTTDPTEASVDTTSLVDSDDVGIVALNWWFENNHQYLPEINHVKVQIRGIDPTKTIIFSVPDSEGGEYDGNPKRELQLFKNADAIPVPNLRPLSMDFYNIGFMIRYAYDNGQTVKSYGVKNGVELTHCINIGGKEIPYSRVKLKKKDEGFNIPAVNGEQIVQNIGRPLPAEELMIHYRQVEKFISELTTREQAIAWLLERQSTVKDINHHLQIDDVLIWLVS